MILWLAIAAAQPQPPVERPSVPVPLYDNDLQCSTATIYNLPESDPYAAIRSGPSARHRQLTRLSNGDAVFACVRRGNWFGIVFEQPNRGGDCGVQQRRRERTYSGPCRSGWVHYDYLSGYADWISP